MSSKGEVKIASILTKEKVKFVREKQFKDLRSGLYRYDFYLPVQNILIEFNGAQHYAFTPYFHKNRSDFLKAQERDRRKISYALARHIPLYCIPYWDLETLHSFKDLLRAPYLVTSKFHNDEAWRLQKKKDV